MSSTVCPAKRVLVDIVKRQDEIVQAALQVAGAQVESLVCIVWVVLGRMSCLNISPRVL